MRLHGPWQFEPLVRTVVHPDGHIEELSGPVPEPGHMTIPANWRGTTLDGFRGRVRWRRNFHSPRSLEPDERLWIVFEGVDYFADVALNGTPLGRHEGYFEPFEYEVTSLVGPRNELVVDVDCPAEAVPGEQRLIRGSRDAAESSGAGIWQDVALEVRSLAFLRDVFIQAEVDGSTGKITASGKVVGEPGVPLGLDLSLDNEAKVGQKLKASATGVDFRVEATIDGAELWWPQNLGTPRTYVVELELHGKARTLDAKKRTVGFRRLAFDAIRASAEFNGRRFPVVDFDLDALRGAHGFVQNDAKKWDEVLQRLSQGTDCLVVARTAGDVLAPMAYDAADVQGMLLQQDFPLGGGYSTELAFRAEATRQAGTFVRQLAHHPSIASWSCHSNPSPHDRELDDSVRAAITQLDTGRICQM